MANSQSKPLQMLSRSFAAAAGLSYCGWTDDGESSKWRVEDFLIVEDANCSNNSCWDMENIVDLLLWVDPIVDEGNKMDKTVEGIDLLLDNLDMMDHANTKDIWKSQLERQPMRVATS